MGNKIVELLKTSIELGIFTKKEAMERINEQIAFEKRISTIEGLESELNKYGN